MDITQTGLSLFIGLMSGTSLDGVDGVLATFRGGFVHTMASAYIPFIPALRAELMALQTPGENEIHREALAAQVLMRCYADCVEQLLVKSNVKPTAIRAIGAHGQTIRHRPELGYTRQINNPALLAELTGIDVIADFRSRDIAAGGQGAPLVPAFHQSAFGSKTEARVVVNIGGISNISVLEHDDDTRLIGFDTGPGNILMDAWITQHQLKPYDADGAWAASGTVHAGLLDRLREESFFSLAPPKSTGRDLFHLAWLATRLTTFSDLPAADVQATLASFTATTIADAIAAHAAGTQAIYVCGGGAYNTFLMLQLQQALIAHRISVTLQSSDALGIAPNQVEALAFAWLAQRHSECKTGNHPAVTGAKGFRILGALFPS